MRDRFKTFTDGADKELLEFIQLTKDFYEKIKSDYYNKMNGEMQWTVFIEASFEFNSNYNKYCRYLRNKSRLFLKDADTVEIIVKNQHTGKNEKNKGKLITKNYKTACDVISTFKSILKEFFEEKLEQKVEEVLNNSDIGGVKNFNILHVFNIVIDETRKNMKYANFGTIAQAVTKNLQIVMEAFRAVNLFDNCA